MLTPPFKRSAGALFSSSSVNEGGVSLPGASVCCDHDKSEAVQAESASAVRTRLHQLDGHLHCSVIGTCLGTQELRRLMAKHVSVAGASDLDVHHLAVSLAVQGGEVSKALHKALDQRHAGAVRTFTAARDEASLAQVWQQAWNQGDIPGAYWALLTHKAVTPELRQEAFGEVHMLSHLMGSANRDELKRFVSMEKDHAELQERLEREQSRRQEALKERDELTERLRLQGLEFERRLQEAEQRVRPAVDERQTAALVALHTERRERAERQAGDAQQRLLDLELHLEQVQEHGRALAEELSAAEHELHQLSAMAKTLDAGEGADRSKPEAPPLLTARRVLYVGGRPSSTPSIRDFVHRHGGEFLHHDGGLETRKGLLSALLPRADLVVFPVDCVDHDSVTNLKRLAERHQVPFMPLRSASLASFAAALRREVGGAGMSAAAAGQPGPRFCLRHG